MWFQNGSNKVVIEPRVVQFWSEIILVILNRTLSAHSFDFEITRMISDQIALHWVQLPLWIGRHSVLLPLLIMASCIARGRVRTTTTTTTESPNMAAILQITGWQRDMQPWFTVYFFGIGHPCYDQLTPVKTRYPLTSITWPYRGLKLTAHRGHVFFWSRPLTGCCFFDWIAGSCLGNLLKTGQNCSGSRLMLT